MSDTNSAISKITLQNRQLLALQAAGVIISSGLDLQTVLNAVTREMANLLNATACALSGWDQDSNCVQMMAEHGPAGWWDPEELLEEFSLGNYPLTRRVLEERCVQQMMISQPEIDPSEYAYMKKEGIGSQLLLPMIFQDRVLGLVEVFDTHERYFDEQDISLAQLLCMQASAAIENARLYSETQQQLQREIILRSTAQALASTLDLKTLLGYIAEKMGEAIGATSAYISSYDQKNKTSLVLAEYFSAEANRKERVSDLNVVYNHNKVMPSTPEVIEKGKIFVVHVNDPESDGDIRTHLEEFGGKSALYIPLSTGGQFAGFAELWESRYRREFTPKEISLCETLAQHAAIALENSRLFTRAQIEIETRKQIEERLLHEALHDALTGLPNRILLNERLERAIIRHQRDNQRLFAVLYLDLDNFKVVNDSLGHNMGDKLLVEIATRMNACVREVDTIARFGGDEFIFILEDMENLQISIQCAQRIQNALKKRLDLDGHEVFISASIGIVLSSNIYKNPNEYLRDADIAMYHAKASNRGGIEVFSPALRQRAIKRLTLESELRRAIKQEEFTVHYQPIVSLEDKKIQGFEALMRWRHPEQGTIFPGEFIDLAEETGLIIPVGDLVLNEACQQIKDWQLRYPHAPPFSISVNLSSKQLFNPDLITTTNQLLTTYGVEANCLNLEITESTLAHKIDSVTLVLHQLKELGVGTHLDNFGTGYSSLKYLRNLPFDVIKIDRAFISGINEYDGKGNLVKTIIMIAQELGMQVIAEGIESQEQLAQLLNMGCRMGQGFHLYCPDDRSAIERLLVEHKKL